ncbi:malate dehydrogenase [Agromyces seonyuensis]|uniref:Malate dehydrogenase n=1 Tax=Agromyces seonyuensis TaxID=2662446 RepID=A0A6I4NUU3_9MICO|nr:malate dehydrogenase [Agromyces seonyuensis]MWB97861.1 malate dehydrogenase [Agromyces seonyuensis]
MAATRPVTIAITGAGGQIGYALAFRIAAGDLLGPETRVRLRLLEIPQGVRAAEGTALELEDGAFPLLEAVDVTTDAERGFDGVEHALLVGAKPRGPGMTRADLLGDNAAIFVAQGAALNAAADDAVRITVVGNPANTNALIASAHAPDIPASRFSALTRLDHNRGLAQLANAVDARVDELDGFAVWGNHSASMFPDVSRTTARGDRVTGILGARLGGPDGVREWLVDTFIPRVANRGAEIIEARGSSSAASAANATIDHVRDWSLGSTGTTSAAVRSDGAYGIPAGVFASFPVHAIDGEWVVQEGFEPDAFARDRIDASAAELVAERDAVRALGLL